MQNSGTINEEKVITLEEYEYKNGCIQSYQAAAIIKLVCIALDKLHNNKIIYRELCPANILLVYDKEHECEKPKEARLAESAAQRQYRDGALEDTVLMGIEQYAAPEQYGFAQSMPATDIFAAGVIFNEMVTGKTPDEEKVPDTKCAYIIAKCCNLDWKKRYQNVHKLIKDIDWYLSHKKSGNFAWHIHKNTKLFVADTAFFILLCAGILIKTGIISHKKDSMPSAEIKQIKEQKTKPEQKYQKYIVDGRNIVFYYPQGFHYSYKKETEENIFVYFSSDIGDTGQIITTVFNIDKSYTPEEVSKLLIQYFNNLYPGKVIYNKIGKKHLKTYYKINVEGKEGIMGINLKIEHAQKHETVIAVMGAFLAEEEKKYRKYFDEMLEKIEY